MSYTFYARKKIPTNGPAPCCLASSAELIIATFRNREKPLIGNNLFYDSLIRIFDDLTI